VGTLPLASPDSATALLHAVDRALSANVPVALDVNWRPTFWSGGADPQDGPSTAVQAQITPLLHKVRFNKGSSKIK
jgi:fructokinase